MHTTVIQQREDRGAVAPGDVRIFHNSDWSGVAEVQWSDEEREAHRVTMPGWVARVLYGEDGPSPGVEP